MAKIAKVFALDFEGAVKIGKRLYRQEGVFQVLPSERCWVAWPILPGGPESDATVFRFVNNRWKKEK